MASAFAAVVAGVSVFLFGIFTWVFFYPSSMFDWLYRRLGGAFTRSPSDCPASCTQETQDILKAAFADLTGRVFDVHTHLGGIGTGGTGCCVTPAARQPFWHPVVYMKYKVLLSACGIPSDQESQADALLLHRLVDLLDNIKKHYPWGQNMLLALDSYYDKLGKRRTDLTSMLVPNEYVERVCSDYSQDFLFCASVHPYRPDALRELERVAAAGARAIKWLPNIQGMDPADPLCDDFYEKLKELDLVLLCHIGKESSLEGPGCDQEMGNPLRLRRALDCGVKVIAAHCGSSGKCADLDDPMRPSVPAFSLFMRLMNEPKYSHLLFADISAMAARARLPVPLHTMLDHTEWHHRLVYGSDYPVPAAAVAVSTKSLVSHGFIARNEADCLNELYNFNPILFSYVMMRLVRSPTTGKRFPPEIFTWNRKLLGPPPTIAKAGNAE